MKVLLTATSARIPNHMLPALLNGLTDHRRHAVQFVRSEFGRGDVEQRRHRLLRRAVEERLEHVLDGGELGLLSRHGRQVDIAEPFLLVPHMPLIFRESGAAHAPRSSWTHPPWPRAPRRRR